jgi:hypothetical protein
MKRTTLTIDGHSFVLAQNTPLDELKSAAERAVSEGGRFVDLTLVGNIAVSALVSPGVSVVLTSHDVPEDNRDTGNLGDPYQDDSMWGMTDLF